MGAVTDGKYSHGNGKDNNNDSAPGSSNFSRVLIRGVLVFILGGLFLSYTTRMFTGSSAITKNEQAQFWRVDSLTQTEIVVNTHRRTQPEATGLNRNKTVPLSQSDSVETDKQNVTQGTGPASDDIIRPITMDKHNDSSISSSGRGNDAIQTIFSTLQLSYTDIKLGEDNGIPTVQFLDVSEALKPLLDAVGSSVSLIEGDIGGNAQKLRKCYDETPTQCQTIQDMLTYDIKMGRAEEDERSVVSLTWFKRAFEFIKKLMVYIANGAEPYDAAKAAYEEVLSKHHGFVVRFSFKGAMNLLPSRDNFLKNLVVNEADLAKPSWKAEVTADMKQYFLGMENILSILREFFKEHKLEN
ncbi:pleckstrin homology domain-containing family A member 8-like [Patiria miniata]|uniref:Glycolipid transfer protein domain-containing protein n=1 Tax=Patiria miniata TaxID=46514 RepID=A0A914BIM0_PATMI|nr:pleckstrin homology domain-containing family A member 8-like [Patiria miniata]